MSRCIWSEWDRGDKAAESSDACDPMHPVVESEPPNGRLRVVAVGKYRCAGY